MNKQNSVIQSITMAVIMSMFTALMVIHIGCASTKTAMVSGKAVPASEGTVITDVDDNGNTILTIHVKNLAPASKVVPDATTYVVWIVPRNGTIQNIGALVLNEKLEGNLVAITAHRRFKVTITPEASSMVSQPSNKPVFSTDVERSE